MRHVHLSAFFLVVEACGAAAHANETVTYIYDAKARLVKVVHSGSINNGVTSQYSHDRTGNRTNVKVTGAH